MMKYVLVTKIDVIIPYNVSAGILPERFLDENFASRNCPEIVASPDVTQCCIRYLYIILFFAYILLNFLNMK